MLSSRVVALVIVAATACSAKSGGGGSFTDDASVSDDAFVSNDTSSDTPALPDLPLAQDAVDATSPSSSFGLSISRWFYLYQVGGFTAPSCSRYLVINLSLRNQSETQPLSLDQDFFSVQTSAGLVLSNTSVSYMLSDGCTSRVAVASGGMASCSIAIQMPRSEVPARLIYRDAAMRSTSLPLPPPERPDCNVGFPFYTRGGSCLSPCTAQMNEVFRLESQIRSYCVTRTCTTAVQVCGQPDMCFVNAECRAAVLAVTECAAQSCAPACATP